MYMYTHTQMYTHINMDYLIDINYRAKYIDYKEFLHISKEKLGNSLAVQGLELHALTVEGPGLIPGQGTETFHNPHGTAWGKKS